MIHFNTHIIHVSTATEREKHMLQVLSKHGCLSNYEFILEGDIKDLNNEVLEKYFSENEMLLSQVSCAYKHILTYKKIIESELEYALILEDDIFLAADFCKIIQEIISEVKENRLENFMISLEDSSLKFVNKSEIKKGKHLYQRTECRFAGAYLIDRKAAQNILKEIIETKVSIPIDWFLNHCAEIDKLNIYWSHPTIASQGSTSGSMKTLIGEKRFGIKRIISRNLQKVYKKLLSKFR